MKQNILYVGLDVDDTRKLPCQVDTSKVSTLALSKASAGVNPPRLSWSRSSLYSSIQFQVISRTSSRLQTSPGQRRILD